MVSHIEILLVFVMVSSGLLCVTFLSVLLALKYKKCNSRPYLLASGFYLLQALGIVNFLRTPILNANIEMSFCTILKTGDLILGFITFFFLLAYIVEINDIGKLKPKSFLLAIALFLTASTTLILLRPSPVHSLGELFGNITRPDVIIRLVIVLLMIVLPIIVACQSYEWRQCMVPRKTIIALHTFSILLAPVFVAGLMCGFFPAVIVNFILAITVDGLVAYIELKIRIPVTELHEEPIFDESSDESILDCPQSWMNPDITITELASIKGLDSGCLLEQIKNQGYQSFSDMIYHKRVEFICKELEKGTGKNITSLLFEAGFRSRSTGSREFKRIKGCTPSEYQETISKS